ncbi:MAG: hypothetical protein Q8R31_04845 [Candidatus Omnitrophota bacterium]|nr:hypothetical protein [Candidatus Omnitrophota bacterium]
MAKKTTKKAVKSKKGSRYACGVCGLAITVDNICGCVDTCDIVCCGEGMKRKK